MQANHIVLSIREAEAEAFEALFEAEELPIWKEMAAQGSLVAANLTRIGFGGEEEDGVRHYGLFAAFTSMAGHSAHDDDPRFKRMLVKARKMQPKPPLVFGGETIFEVRGGG
jgi:hypothetical protein